MPPAVPPNDWEILRESMRESGWAVRSQAITTTKSDRAPERRLEGATDGLHPIPAGQPLDAYRIPPSHPMSEESVRERYALLWGAGGPATPEDLAPQRSAGSIIRPDVDS